MKDKDVEVGMTVNLPVEVVFTRHAACYVRVPGGRQIEVAYEDIEPRDEERFFYDRPEDVSGTVFDPSDETFGPIMAALQAGEFETAASLTSELANVVDLEAST